jgi:hypothetical protein
MKGRALTFIRPAVALLATALVAAGLGAAPASAGKSGDDVPERLLVTAREFSLTLSKPKIGAGDSIVQLYDFGEDPHNLELQRVGGGRVFDIGEVEPGETGELRLRLKRSSTYRLWCSLANHAALGMDVTLRTKRR